GARMERVRAPLVGTAREVTGTARHQAVAGRLHVPEERLAELDAGVAVLDDRAEVRRLRRRDPLERQPAGLHVAALGPATRYAARPAALRPPARPAPALRIGAHRLGVIPLPLGVGRPGC